MPDAVSFPGVSRDVSSSLAGNGMGESTGLHFVWGGQSGLVGALNGAPALSLTTPLLPSALSALVTWGCLGFSQPLCVLTATSAPAVHLPWYLQGRHCEVAEGMQAVKVDRPEWALVRL